MSGGVFPAGGLVACIACVACGLGGVDPPPGGSGELPGGGTVGPGGGAVERLWFATTGDTRPPRCDETALYPRETMARLARSMRALQVQFALDLGDHMFVCGGSRNEARRQMGFYLEAIAQGPAPFFMTMGNHECGERPCLPGSSDANFTAYLEALGRPRPWYSFDVQTALGLSRFVVIADDSWDGEQARWLEETLADADRRARITIVARHHPLTGRGGAHEAVRILERHRYSLILSAHRHSYAREGDHGGRTAIVGLGGAPGHSPPGFATVLQERDGRLTFVLRDLDGAPSGPAWSVWPQ